MAASCLQAEPEEGRQEKQVASNSMRRAVWENHMAARYPQLSQVASRLLSMHATQCSTERNWSKWHAVCRYNRSSLGLEKAKQMIFVSCMAAWRKGGDTTAELDAELVANFAKEEAEDDLRNVAQELA